tara:strand:- start:321 stop:461 length:141 start_codon:yes stop_codon:yes gene_type:complete
MELIENPDLDEGPFTQEYDEEDGVHIGLEGPNIEENPSMDQDKPHF